MPNNEIIIVGAFSEIVELCEIAEKRIIGIFDNSINESFMGYEILGNDTYAINQIHRFKDVPIIVTPDNPHKRKKIVYEYKKKGYKFANLIHPNAAISRYANIGEGVIIQNWVNISSNTLIGDFVKLNTFANVMHDCRIGNFTTIAPNSIVLGRVTVNENCYIGANSIILPSVNVEKNAIIGAGAVVTKSVNSGNVMIGVPARKMK